MRVHAGMELGRSKLSVDVNMNHVVARPASLDPMMSPPLSPLSPNTSDHEHLPSRSPGLEAFSDWMVSLLKPNKCFEPRPDLNISWYN